jgi:hypothetical protein
VELMQFHGTYFDTKVWVEDVDGKLIPVEQLCVSNHSTRLIQELSNYIVLEAWIFQLRFQHDGLDIFVCRCHPNTTHGGSCQPEDRVGTVYPDELSLIGSQLYKDRSLNLGTVYSYTIAKGSKRISTI